LVHELVESNDEKPSPEKPQSLRGDWSGAFPEDFKGDAELKEIAVKKGGSPMTRFRIILGLIFVLAGLAVYTTLGAGQPEQKASMICCAVHGAVGWVVTFKWTTRLLS
jgi:uncharacterized membrane protein YeaQ/YmgE (transglycosylase-associated protein family)